MRRCSTCFAKVTGGRDDSLAKNVVPQAIRRNARRAAMNRARVSRVRTFVKKVEGTVLLEVVIDETGRVTRQRIFRSSPLLDAAAMRCAQEWQFEPAIKDGRRVAAHARIAVAFTIF